MLDAESLLCLVHVHTMCLGKVYTCLHLVVSGMGMAAIHGTVPVQYGTAVAAAVSVLVAVWASSCQAM